MLINRHPKLELVDAEAIRQIHETSLRILDAVGVVFTAEDARCFLGTLPGVRIDPASGRVRFSPDTIERLARQCPPQFTLHGRDPRRTVTIGGDVVAFGPVVGCRHVVDLVRGRRTPTMVDLVELVKICQALPVLDLAGGAICVPQDVPADTRHLHVAYALLKHSDRPMVGSWMGYERAKDVFEMARLARGGDDLARRPGVITAINPSSPLCYEDQQCGAIIAHAEERQPLVISPAVVGGLTGPVTLAGALAQQNAEVLAGIALAQAVAPGTPMVYGGVTTIGDMRQGGSPYGGPESGLATSLSAQLARFYGLPSRAGGCLTDAKLPDAQSGFERMMVLMVTVQSGVHFVHHAVGMLESFGVASYEQIVLDADAIGYLATLLGGVKVSAATLAFDVVAQVGPRGSFLTTEHTFDHFRASLYEPLVADRKLWPAWEQEGRRTATERASDIWSRLLAESAVEPLDPAVDRELQRLIAARERPQANTSGGVRASHPTGSAARASPIAPTPLPNQGGTAGSSDAGCPAIHLTSVRTKGEDVDVDKLLKDITDAVLAGDTPRTGQLVSEGIAAQVDPSILITDGMIKAMDEAGARFSRGEYYVPELLMSAKAMQKGMELVKPLLVGDKAIEPLGRLVIGTVKGDLHDIGKNLVAIMAEGAGMQVIDLGRDTKPEKFIEAVRDNKANFVGMSALLTTTMPNMNQVVKGLTAAGIRDQVSVIVGGAPVTQEWADKIHAEAYAPDAASAVNKMKSMLGVSVEA